MATSTLALPNELLAQLGTGDHAADVARIVALQLFRDNKVSLLKAAELAETPIEVFKAFAQSHGERPPDFMEHDEARRELLTKAYLESLGLPAPPWKDPSAVDGVDVTDGEILDEVAEARRTRRERSNPPTATKR